MYELLLAVSIGAAPSVCLPACLPAWRRHSRDSQVDQNGPTFLPSAWLAPKYAEYAILPATIVNRIPTEIFGIFFVLVPLIHLV